MKRREWKNEERLQGRFPNIVHKTFRNYVHLTIRTSVISSAYIDLVYFIYF